MRRTAFEGVLPATQAVGSSPNTGQENPTNEQNGAGSIGLYHKCLDCPDYGVSCNGPKLAALGDIMVVREFHRAIRDRRAIQLKMIYLAAPSISEYTINDYFSHSVKDFKWTTVGAIDNALTAICGNRVGQPLLDNPCPASSTDITEQFGRYEKTIRELEEENKALQQKVTETKGKVIATREEVKEDYASRVQFLKELCEKRENDIEQLNKKHDADISRMDALAKNYLERIDEKNARIDRMSRALKWVSIGLGVAILILACYVVWDLTHPSAGFFRW